MFHHHSPVGIALDSVGTLPKASASLQTTLNHPRSFAAFYHWLSRKGRAHVLDFWLAIWAFRRACHERDPRAQRIGIAFHRRFVSPRTGCCEFLPAPLRAERSARLQRGEPVRDDFFDACAPHAWACLSREHAPFALEHHATSRSSRAAAEKREMAENGCSRECDGSSDGREAEEEGRAFALQLVRKLDALARQQQQQRPRFAEDNSSATTPPTAERQASESGEEEVAEGGAACGDADGGRAEAATAVVTPERMCAWMQFASAYSDLTALSSSSCCYADGISSSSSSTAGGGGHITFKQNVAKPVLHQAAAAAVGHHQQQQKQQQRQMHCDNATPFGVMYGSPTATASSCCAAAVAARDDTMTTTMMTSAASSSSNNCTITSPASSCWCCCSMSGGGGATASSAATAATVVPTTTTPTMTITYREAGGVGPPFVVRVARQAMVTFREFRHLFAIPARSNKRFLFKEHRFDGPLDSAHFQWTAIYDDDSPLPIFFGQIVAECRTLSESD